MSALDYVPISRLEIPLAFTGVSTDVRRPICGCLTINGAGAAIEGGRFNRPAWRHSIFPLAPKPRSKNIDRARALLCRLHSPHTRSRLVKWPTCRKISVRFNAKRAGLSGSAHGGKSLVSTKRFLRHGNSHAGSFRAVFMGCSFCHYVTPGESIL